MKNILCTVGSEKFPFDRLMQWIETLAEEFSGYKFFVQSGSSTYIPKADNIHSFNFLSELEFAMYCRQADILIGHCGEGTIIQAVRFNKPYILIPRKSSLGEHVDDHQFELARLLSDIGASIALTLNELRNRIMEPKYVEFKLGGSEARETLEQIMLKDVELSNDSTALLVCSGGGHFTSMLLLEDFYGKFQNKIWATFKMVNIEEKLNGEEVIWAYHPTIRNIPNCIRNFFLAYKNLFRRKVDVVITTGAGISVPFLIAAKLCGNPKIIFIELATRVEGLSLSAKILCNLNIVDYCLVHHTKLKKVYKDNSKVVLISDYAKELNLCPVM